MVRHEGRDPQRKKYYAVFNLFIVVIFLTSLVPPLASATAAIDTTAPVTTYVVNPANVVGLGDTITFYVNFDEEILVNGGEPRLQFNIVIGATIPTTPDPTELRNATYRGTSGDRLEFTYQIQANDVGPSGSLLRDAVTLFIPTGVTVVTTSDGFTVPLTNSQSFAISNKPAITAVSTATIASVPRVIRVWATPPIVVSPGLLTFFVQYDQDIASVEIPAGNESFLHLIFNSTFVNGTTISQAARYDSFSGDTLAFVYTVTRRIVPGEVNFVSNLFASNGVRIIGVEGQIADSTIPSGGRIQPVTISRADVDIPVEVNIRTDRQAVAGQAFHIYIDYHERVFIDTENGIPNITITGGTRPRTASYDRASGNTLIFKYQIAEDETGIIGTTATYNHNNGVIRDLTDSRLGLLRSPGPSLTQINGQLPTIQNANPPDTIAPVCSAIFGIGNYGVGDDIAILISCNEEVDFVSTNLISAAIRTSGNIITNGETITEGSFTIAGEQRTIRYVRGRGEREIEYVYTVQANDGDEGTIGNVILPDLQDLNGNQRPTGALSVEADGVVINAIAPALAEVTVSGVPTPYITTGATTTPAFFSRGDILSIIVGFDKAVNVTGVPIFNVKIGDSEPIPTYYNHTETSGSGGVTYTNLVFTRQITGAYGGGLSYEANPLELNEGDSIRRTVGGTPANLLISRSTRNIPIFSGYPDSIFSANGERVVRETTTPVIARADITAGEYTEDPGSNELAFILTWSEPINITAANGANLSFTIGKETKTAVSNTAGTRLSELTFTYTVQVGDAGSIVIPGGSVISGNGVSIIAADNGDIADLSVPANFNTGARVKVLDKAPPECTARFIDGIYGLGDVLRFTVSCDESITFTNNQPQDATFVINGNTRTLTYQNGIGTQQINYAYTIQAGDGNNQAITQINLPSIEDTEGNSVDYAVTNPTPSAQVITSAQVSAGILRIADTSAVLIYAVAPTITSIASPQAGNELNVNEELELNVVFSEPVSIIGSPALRIRIGQNDVTANYKSSSSATLTFSYIITEEDRGNVTVPQGTLGGGIVATTGGTPANTDIDATIASTNLRVTVADPRIPHIQTITPAPHGLYKIGDTLSFILQYDEVITVAGNPTFDFTIGGQTKTATYTSATTAGLIGSALTFTYQIVEGDEGPLFIPTGSITRGSGITIQDSDGNDADDTILATTTSIQVDGVSPVATLTSPRGAYGEGSAIRFTLTSSEPLVRPTNSDGRTVSIEPSTHVTFSITQNEERTARYISGEGTATWVYEYIVTPRDIADIRRDTTDSIIPNTDSANPNTGSVNIDEPTIIATVTSIQFQGSLTDRVGNTLTTPSIAPHAISIENKIGYALDFSITSAQYFIKTEGTSIVVTAIFSEAVTITGNGGPLYIPFKFSNTTRTDKHRLTYSGGSGTTRLEFRYTVQEGDVGELLIEEGNLELNQASLDPYDSTEQRDIQLYHTNYVGPFAIASTFGGGAGTETSPFLISTPYDFYSIRYNQTSNAYYRLTDDIPIDVPLFSSPRNFLAFANTFSAKIDGDGYAVTGLILRTASIFERFDGTLKNIALEQVEVTSGASVSTLFASNGLGTNAIINNVKISIDDRSIDTVNFLNGATAGANIENLFIDARNTAIISTNNNVPFDSSAYVSSLLADTRGSFGTYRCQLYYNLVTRACFTTPSGVEANLEIFDTYDFVNVWSAVGSTGNPQLRTFLSEDKQSPYIERVTLPQGEITVGDTITFTVHFNEEVIASDDAVLEFIVDPILTAGINAENRRNATISEEGINIAEAQQELNFTYAITIADIGKIRVGTRTLGGQGIVDTDGNALTTKVFIQTTGGNVDQTRPSIQTVSIYANNDFPEYAKDGAEVFVKIDFSEEVTTDNLFVELLDQPRILNNIYEFTEVVSQNYATALIDIDETLFEDNVTLKFKIQGNFRSGEGIVGSTTNKRIYDYTTPERTPTGADATNPGSVTTDFTPPEIVSIVGTEDEYNENDTLEIDITYSDTSGEVFIKDRNTAVFNLRIAGLTQNPILDFAPYTGNSLYTNDNFGVYNTVISNKGLVDAPNTYDWGAPNMTKKEIRGRANDPVSANFDNDLEELRNDSLYFNYIVRNGDHGETTARELDVKVRDKAGNFADNDISSFTQSLTEVVDITDPRIISANYLAGETGNALIVRANVSPSLFSDEYGLGENLDFVSFAFDEVVTASGATLDIALDTFAQTEARAIVAAGQSNTEVVTLNPAEEIDTIVQDNTGNKVYYIAGRNVYGYDIVQNDRQEILPDTFTDPIQLQIGNDNLLYVFDRSSGRVHVVDPERNVIVSNSTELDREVTETIVEPISEPTLIPVGFAEVPFDYILDSGASKRFTPILLSATGSADNLVITEVAINPNPHDLIIGDIDTNGKIVDFRHRTSAEIDALITGEIATRPGVTTAQVTAEIETALAIPRQSNIIITISDTINEETYTNTIDLGEVRILKTPPICELPANINVGINGGQSTTDISLSALSLANCGDIVIPGNSASPGPAPVISNTGIIELETQRIRVRHTRESYNVRPGETRVESATITLLNNGQVSQPIQVTVTIHGTCNGKNGVDTDCDNLIDIDTQEKFANIKNNLEGTSYIPQNGQPSSQGCFGGGCEGYELTNDITITNTLTTTASLGSIGSSGSPFNTLLEGNNHSIINYKFNTPTSDRDDNVGLFRHAGSNARIQNVRLVNANISGNENVGGFVGNADDDTQIIGSTVEDSFIIGNTNVGRFAGTSNFNVLDFSLNDQNEIYVLQQSNTIAKDTATNIVFDASSTTTLDPEISAAPSLTSASTEAKARNITGFDVNTANILYLLDNHTSDSVIRVNTADDTQQLIYTTPDGIADISVNDGIVYIVTTHTTPEIYRYDEAAGRILIEQLLLTSDVGNLNAIAREKNGVSYTATTTGKIERIIRTVALPNVEHDDIGIGQNGAYVVQSNTLFRISPINGALETITTLAGSLFASTTDREIKVDSNNNIYISNKAGSIIVKVDNVTGTRSEVLDTTTLQTTSKRIAIGSQNDIYIVSKPASGNYILNVLNDQGLGQPLTLSVAGTSTLNSITIIDNELYVLVDGNSIVKVTISEDTGTTTINEESLSFRNPAYGQINTDPRITTPATLSGATGLYQYNGKLYVSTATGTNVVYVNDDNYLNNVIVETMTGVDWTTPAITGIDSTGRAYFLSASANLELLITADSLEEGHTTVQKQARYHAGTDTNNLTFRYTVAEEDEAEHGIRVKADAINNVIDTAGRTNVYQPYDYRFNSIINRRPRISLQAQPDSITTGDAENIRLDITAEDKNPITSYTLSVDFAASDIGTTYSFTEGNITGHGATFSNVIVNEETELSRTDYRPAIGNNILVNGKKIASAPINDIILTNYESVLNILPEGNEISTEVGVANGKAYGVNYADLIGFSSNGQITLNGPVKLLQRNNFGTIHTDTLLFPSVAEIQATGIGESVTVTSEQIGQALTLTNSGRVTTLTLGCDGTRACLSEYVINGTVALVEATAVTNTALRLSNVNILSGTYTERTGRDLFIDYIKAGVDVELAVRVQVGQQGSLRITSSSLDASNNVVLSGTAEDFAVTTTDGDASSLIKVTDEIINTEFQALSATTIILSEPSILVEGQTAQVVLVNDATHPLTVTGGTIINVTGSADNAVLTLNNVIINGGVTGIHGTETTKYVEILGVQFANNTYVFEIGNGIFTALSNEIVNPASATITTGETGSVTAILLSETRARIVGILNGTIAFTEDNVLASGTHTIPTTDDNYDHRLDFSHELRNYLYGLDLLNRGNYDITFTATDNRLATASLTIPIGIGEPAVSTGTGGSGGGGSGRASGEPRVAITEFGPIDTNDERLILKALNLTEGDVTDIILLKQYITPEREERQTMDVDTVKDRVTAFFNDEIATTTDEVEKASLAQELNEVITALTQLEQEAIEQINLRERNRVNVYQVVGCATCTETRVTFFERHVYLENLSSDLSNDTRIRFVEVIPKSAAESASQVESLGRVYLDDPIIYQDRTVSELRNIPYFDGSHAIAGDVSDELRQDAYALTLVFAPLEEIQPTTTPTQSGMPSAIMNRISIIVAIIVVLVLAAVVLFAVYNNKKNQKKKKK